MASFRCLQLTALLTGIAGAVFSAPSLALQALDDVSLSDVTGQAQGLKITQENEIQIDSVQYFDDDGWGPNGVAGSITLSDMRIYTEKNKPIITDVQVKEVGGKRALVITNHQLALNQKIGAIMINNDSIGSLGQDNYKFNPGDVLTVNIFPGGYGNTGGDGGISVDVEVPSSLAYDVWQQNNGVRQTTTINYDDPYNPGLGGIKFRDMTVDIEKDGLRIGLPTVTNGFVNLYNTRIGPAPTDINPNPRQDVLYSYAFRNINLLSGGYVLLKNAKQAQDIGLEIDTKLKAGSNLDFVYIFGEVGASYPNSSIYEMSAHLELGTDLDVKGMRMNVDGERGIVFDFDNTNPQSGISANLVVSDLTLLRSDRVATASNTPSLGMVDMQLNLSNNSYLQVQGH